MLKLLKNYHCQKVEKVLLLQDCCSIAKYVFAFIFVLWLLQEKLWELITLQIIFIIWNNYTVADAYNSHYTGCLYACVCVCPPPRLLITSGKIWCDVELLWLVKQVVGVSLSFIWQLTLWQIDKLVGVTFVNKAHCENCTYMAR